MIKNKMSKYLSAISLLSIYTFLNNSQGATASPTNTNPIKKPSTVSLLNNVFMGNNPFLTFGEKLDIKLTTSQKNLSPNNEQFIIRNDAKVYVTNRLTGESTSQNIKTLRNSITASINPSETLDIYTHTKHGRKKKISISGDNSSITVFSIKEGDNNDTIMKTVSLKFGNDSSLTSKRISNNFKVEEEIDYNLLTRQAQQLVKTTQFDGGEEKIVKTPNIQTKYIKYTSGHIFNESTSTEDGTTNQILVEPNGTVTQTTLHPNNPTQTVVSVNGNIKYTISETPNSKITTQFNDDGNVISQEMLAKLSDNSSIQSITTNASTTTMEINPDGTIQGFISTPKNYE